MSSTCSYQENCFVGLIQMKQQEIWNIKYTGSRDLGMQRDQGDFESSMEG